MVQAAWPEKAVCLIALAFGLALVCLGSLLNAKSMQYGWLDAAADIEWHFMRVACLPLWLVFRAVDFLTGGPGRRAAFIARPPQ